MKKNYIIGGAITGLVFTIPSLFFWNLRVFLGPMLGRIFIDNFAYIHLYIDELSYQVACSVILGVIIGYILYREHISYFQETPGSFLTLRNVLSFLIYFVLISFASWGPFGIGAAKSANQVLFFAPFLIMILRGWFLHESKKV